ncbi:MAG: type VI secretion system-associated FHA domain protein TagH [Pseudomonas sp.]|uniref:type VI secretion system-associated FHA domain protein TagH n=1 Tax=Pseudomonas sp. TaxID=306 RepID=UPI003C70CD3C
MKLEFEIMDAEDAGSLSSARRTFDGVGGVIGRGAGCDWMIPDSSRLLSSHHGLIAYREGQYFLTDISSNGIDLVGSTERLRKGQARLITDGEAFRLGSLTIRVRLIERTRPVIEHDYIAMESIPDDAFLTLDPIQSLDREEQRQATSQALVGLGETTAEPEQRMVHSAIDREHLVMPRRAEPVRETLSTPSVATPADDEVFWAQFTAALGIRLEAVDPPTRQALAIKVARLLRLAMEGLQQSLSTCEGLKSELGLPLFDTRFKRQSPLKDHSDTDAALAALLGTQTQGQLSAEQAVTQAHRDLQVHQVALLAACRSAVRTARTAFAPGHLLTCFHYQEKRPRFPTDGGHWRAYQRHYQRVIANSNDPLPGDGFAKVYEEQVRLISTLHVEYPG